MMALREGHKHPLWVFVGGEALGVWVSSLRLVTHRHGLLKLKHSPGNISPPALWLSLWPPIWPTAGCFQYLTIPFCKPQIFRKEPRTESTQSYLQGPGLRSNFH